MAEAPSHYVECLPFECYVLRSFMDTRECVELAARIAQLADGAMPPWRTIATTQDHPLIAISHNANQTRRSRACERACGLKACTGACGAHVGVLTECPKDIFDLAQRCAQQINDTIGGTPLPPFRPTHFWALLYGQQGRQNAMAPHLDRPVGWTLSVCVGGDATCTVGCPPAKGSLYAEYNVEKAKPGQSAETGTQVVLRAGDAMLFEGHSVFHSVDSTSANQGVNLAEALGAPATAHDNDDGGGDVWKPTRLALLFRDQRADE